MENRGMLARLVILCVAASFAAVGVATAQTPLERGSYLVNAVMACDGCHTPRGPSGFIMEKRFSGGAGTWDTPTDIVKGSNIAPDRETGIGAGGDRDTKRPPPDGGPPYGGGAAP